MTLLCIGYAVVNDANMPHRPGTCEACGAIVPYDDAEQTNRQRRIVVMCIASIVLVALLTLAGGIGLQLLNKWAIK